jgi:hypothetical protein
MNKNLSRGSENAFALTGLAANWGELIAIFCFVGVGVVFWAAVVA